MKVAFQSGTASSLASAVDPSGTSINWASVSGGNVILAPPSALQGTLGNFLRYSQNSTANPPTYLVSAFAVASTSGANVQYLGGVYTISGLTNSFTGINTAASGVNMYIIFSQISSTSILI